MTSKLGVHYQRVHESQQLRDWLKAWRPSVIKLIVSADNDAPGLDEALACLAPGGRVIIRHHPVSENWEHRGFDSAKSAIEMGYGHATYLVKLWNVIRGKYDIVPEQILWEGLNEPNVWAPAEAPDLTAAYYAEFAKRLHFSGLRGLLLNFGVGWPGNGGVKDAPPIWKPFEPVLDVMARTDYGDVLGLHEYWPMIGPQYAWTWLAGRYTQCPCELPIIIGESGLDNAVARGVRSANVISRLMGQTAFEWPDVNEYIMAMATRNRPTVSNGIAAAANLEHYGFHGLSPNMDEAARIYLDQLKWYDAKLATDKRVLAHCPFTFDFASPWATFDLGVTPMMTLLLGYLVAVGGCAPIIPVPVTPPTSVVWGDKRLSPWRDLIDKYAMMRGLDPMVVGAIIMLESNGAPNIISAAGAVGLMQVMPSPIIVGRPTKNELVDPTTNIEWGTQILKDELVRFGQLDKALVAYNRGRSHGDELTDPKSIKYLSTFMNWWLRLWDTTPPISLPTEPTAPPATPVVDMKAIRWNVEEAVRELEGLQQAAAGMRKRLLENVISPLNKLETMK